MNLTLGQHLNKKEVHWPDYCDSGRFQPILYVSTTGGFCNRLLGIASCIQKARDENRMVKVYWPLNGEDGMSATWSDLIESPSLDLFTDWDLYWLMDVMHEVKVYNHVSDIRPGREGSHIVLVKASYDFFRYHPDAQRTGIEWLQSIKFQPRIIKNADHYRAVDKSVLGVHLRKRETHFHADTFSEQPITVDVIKAVQAWPGTVFIASNSASCKFYAKKMFGPKVIFNQTEDCDRGLNSMEDSVIDLVLLSRCGAIIGETSGGSYVSTFARTAQFMA